MVKHIVMFKLKEKTSEGHGTYTFNSGSKYFGEWHDGKWGVKADSPGSAVKSTQETGRKAREMVREHSTGKVVISTRVTGKTEKRAGQGTLNYSDGSMYQGEWLDGTLNGLGTFTSFDGRKWVGEFRNDQPWNLTLYDKSGKVIEKWFNGKKQ